MYMKLIQNLGALLFFILVILNKIVHQESKYLRKRTLKYFKLAFIKSISSNLKNSVEAQQEVTYLQNKHSVVLASPCGDQYLAYQRSKNKIIIIIIINIIINFSAVH